MTTSLVQVTTDRSSTVVGITRLVEAIVMGSVVMAAALNVACSGFDNTSPPYGTNGGPLPADALADANDGAQSGDPQAPVLVALASNITRFTEQSQITITATLTDPNGVDDLAGGALALERLDGTTVALGAFEPTAIAGTYQIHVGGQTLLTAAAATASLRAGPEAGIALQATFADRASHETSGWLLLTGGCQALPYPRFGSLAQGQCIPYTERDYFGCSCTSDQPCTPDAGTVTCWARYDVSVQPWLTATEFCALANRTCLYCSVGICNSYAAVCTCEPS